jgi:ferric enterobactin receptor
MQKFRSGKLFALTAVALAAHSFVSVNAAETVMEETTVLGTAEDVARQALGSSIITAEDLSKRPVANDISEIIRTMPGVNLTGAASSGAYGNQRQIDLRGMGPENTMILIDGKPVASREAALMRRTGERDTRGDTNWVPADQIERIEVIRGPAAARYGSGAAGGVVNIITKKPTKKLSGSVTAYHLHAENKDEGSSGRLGFNLSGPLADNLSFRLFGNVAKTEGDAIGINGLDANGLPLAAGREGNRNRDINAMLRWDLTPDQSLEFETGFSRQGNIYVGEMPQSASNVAVIKELAESGAELRRTYRQTASVTHRANLGDLGKSRLVMQYENTRNSNCATSNGGSGEGSCLSPLEFLESEQTNYFLNGELNTPLKLGGFNQMLTTGFEYRDQSLEDPNTLVIAPPTGPASTDAKTTAKSFALYIEDNIEVLPSLLLTPGLRLDHHEDFGNNWSPSLNASYELSSDWSLKGGIARVFKTPNLYQSNPNYWYTTMGNGCPAGVAGPCRIQGNPNLSPEISVNKELGVAWNNQQGWEGSLTYFRNDYRNKITADMAGGAQIDMGSYRYYQWSNAGKAVIEGVEGNLNIPLVGVSGDTLKLINNFTWMSKNHSKDTDRPLSVIPKFTINSTLDWRVTNDLSAQLKATVYGRQKPRSHAPTRLSPTAPEGSDAEVPTYTLFGIGGTYNVDKNLRIGFGINNLLDKQILRNGKQASSAGAFTYNEPGRSYYLTATASF